MKLDKSALKNKKIILVLVVVVCLLLVSSAFVVHTKKIQHTHTHPHTHHPALPLSHDFKIKILKVEDTGTLSRRIYAELTNTGGDKKNVRVIFELFVKGERIDVNGKKYLVLRLGNIKRNESVKKAIDISVSFFDGLKIKSAGSVEAKLVILWNNGRQVFFKKVNV